MPNHGEDAEMGNVIDRNVLVSEAGGCLAKKVLRYPGIFCSLLGFGGFGGSFFSLSFLNRWLHLGHFKWILHCVPLLFGLIGLGLIWCSCPSARARIKQACCGKCMKRKNQYDRLVNSSVDEHGEIAT